MYKIGKKVDEVKEVIMNRPDSDIIKVLEYYDYDVGKTIDAFVNDGGKEALLKYDANNNSNSIKNNNNRSNSPVPTQNKQKTNNNNNKPSRSNTNKVNLNDLVASVINQYTSSTPSTPLSSSLSPNSSAQVQQQQQEPQQILLDTLNRLNTDTANTTTSLLSLPLADNQTTTINGYKVTILGVQTNNSASTVVESKSQQSSSTSSPSSMSCTSSTNSTTNSRPSLLELNSNNSNSLLRIPAARKFNTSYVNPNSKQILEKHQKDLQRQTAQLNKLTLSYQDELSKSHILLDQTFNQLRQVLNERQAQLEKQLAQVGQYGNRLLQERQHKAADLRIMSDNSQHLNDQELMELKADMKHFVSERQLDEELAKIKLVNLENLDKIINDLGSFGSISQINDKYSKVRPADLLNAITPVNPNPVVVNSSNNNNTQTTSQQNTNSNKNNNKNVKSQTQTDKNNSKPQPNINGAKNVSSLMNGATGANNSNGVLNGNHKAEQPKSNYVDDGEGEFIEVKKPRKNNFFVFYFKSAYQSLNFK